MIALDTNVLVRFLANDNPKQSTEAHDIVEKLTATKWGYSCREVMVLLVWALERAYKYPRSTIAGTIEGLLSAEELRFEAAGRVGVACNRDAKGGPGFSDQ